MQPALQLIKVAGRHDGDNSPVLLTAVLLDELAYSFDLIESLLVGTLRLDLNERLLVGAFGLATRGGRGR